MWLQTDKQEVLENLQQNLIMPFHTIHDEIDIIIPNYLSEGLTTRIAYISACKDIIDKFGCGYINYLADCETDKTEHSWIPKGKDSMNPYATPHSRIEKLAKEAMENARVELEIVEIKTDLSIKEFRQRIQYDSKGVYVKLITPTKTIISTKPISKESLKPFLKDGNERE